MNISSFNNIDKRRVSAPVIPFFNIIAKEGKKKKEEDIKEEKKKKHYLGDIKENSDDENSEENEEKEEEIKPKKIKKVKKIKKGKKITKKNEKSKEINEENIQDKNNKENKNTIINKCTEINMSTDYRKITGKFRNYNSFSLSSQKLSRQLKEILTQKLCLKDFSDWFNSVIISMQNDDLNEFITYLDCIQESSSLTTEFFKYIYNLSKSKMKGYRYTYEAEKLYKKNKLDQICFITPEIGPWTKVGQLGKTIDELTTGLCALGQDIIIISPYYYENAKGQTHYLKNDFLKFKHMKDISITLDENYSFRIYYGISDIGIKYYFIQNEKLFPYPYPTLNTSDTLREIAGLAKGALELLYDLKISPSIIVTNDWVSGLTPAYGKNGTFGDFFNQTKFIHLCHNLEPMFEGKLNCSENNDYQNIYNFNKDWLIDPNLHEKAINPSRCAILKSDQWATVSKAYKRHLQLNSPLADILNQKPCPFAYPNGIFIKKELKEIQLLAGKNKEECKEYLQQKYFGFEKADYSIPVYSFIGEISEDKGIMLIFDSIDEIMKKANSKINIILFAKGNNNNPSYYNCLNRINNLKEIYKYSFWGNIIESKDSKENARLFLGSDFALLPSKFEPSGTLQHKYFISGTPVIAFKTGSLKDTISEFNYQTNKGNGILFDYYNPNEFIEAFMRSLNIFRNKEKYSICCENAKVSAIDISEVSEAWCKEFCKLKHKLYFDNSKAKDITMSKITDDILIKEYKENEPTFNTKEEGVPIIRRRSNIYGADSFQSVKNLAKKFNINSGQNFLQEDEAVKKFVYYYLNDYQPKVVELSGSFDEWKKRHRLIHYPREKKWEISIKLKKGKYLYKYIIDGNWQTNPREPTEKGEDGFVNNIAYL